MSYIELQGPQGNAYVILAHARKFGKLLDLDNLEEIMEEMMNGDYVNLVNTFIKYFGDVVQVMDNGKEVYWYEGE